MNNATEMLPIKNNNKKIDTINKKYKLNNSEKIFLFELNALKIFQASKYL